MAGRDALGSVDVADAALAEMLDADSIVDSQASVVDYNLTTMTTGGRWWVTGTARHGGSDIPFRLFIKVVQSAHRSPAMAFVPPEFQASVSDVLPWRIEPNAYRSDLASRLPSGMRMPRAYDVADLDDESSALWLEAATCDESPWTPDRYRDAAVMLGRFAASADVSSSSH